MLDMNNQLDAAAMTISTEANWPRLTRLVLRATSISPAAVALVFKAPDWACLTTLSLASVQLDSSCTRSIALLHNQLKDLNFSSTDIDEAALSQFTNSPWPKLRRLSLTGNKVTADVVANLVLAEMPNLFHLVLAGNKLSAAAAQHLANSTWLNLCNRELYNNEFDSTAMAFLAKGNWPNLEVLHCVAMRSVQGVLSC